jgi:N-terminal acetyltransferase B complex non-catalytic subunit
LTFPNRDRNWLEFLSVLDATFLPVSHSALEGDASVYHTVEHSRELFAKVSEEDGLKDRSGRLALLELEHRANKHRVTQGEKEFIYCRCFLDTSAEPSRMSLLMRDYFDSFGDKACCFEDLKPYISEGGCGEFISFIESVRKSSVSLSYKVSKGPDIYFPRPISLICDD